MTFDTSDVKVSEGQKALASYIKKETGKAIKPETIAVIDALREAYRKDPARVAEREAQRAAARARKEEAYRKAVEKAKKLAESLGVEIGNFADVDLTEPEPGETFDDFGNPEDDLGPEDVQPEPVKAKKAPANKAATVTPIRKEPTPNDEDTSAILVVESEDAFETDAPGEGEDDFFDDGAEEY